MTFEQWIADFTGRGVEQIYPSKEKLIEYVKSGGKIQAYFGIDPTGPTLHVGHMIPLRKLAQLQEMGHHVTLLIGDFTAMIGDPTGKSQARKPLTREQVLANAKLYKKQASIFLDFKRPDNPATIRFNSKWLSKLKFEDLITLASEFTVSQMIERDMFQKRIKEKLPIHLHEFLYPLMQGYDSVALDVNMEIGGNDQTFNMLCGRDLLSRRGKEKFVLSTQLLVDPSGNKMGKTTGNMVSLTDTPKDMFGKIMSWPDTIIFIGLRLLTSIDSNQIEEMERSYLNGKAHPMELKKKLAFDVVSLYCGKAKAKKAEQEFATVFQKKEDPTEVPVYTVTSSPINIIELLVLTKLASSKGEAKRFIEQKGVKVNHEVISDEKQMIDCSKETLIQRGKRFFAKVKMQ